MVLRCVNKVYPLNWDYSSSKMGLTIGRTYQCLPIKGDYHNVLVYDDFNKWNEYHINAFAPVDPPPLVIYEED